MSLKFKIDDIVAPEAKKAAEDSLECSVCLSILSDPVQTPCQHVFCGECIAPCLACPNCNAPLPNNKAEKGRPLAECNKFAHGMLQRLKVCCPYHKNAHAENSGGGAPSSSAAPPAKRARKDPRKLTDEFCAWEGEYGDLLSTHLARDCLMHSIPCPKACGVILKRSALSAHEKACTKNFEQCTICGAYVRPGEMMKHRKQTAEAHVGILELRLKDAQAAVVNQPMEFFWKVNLAECMREQNCKGRGDVILSERLPIGAALGPEEHMVIKLFPCGYTSNPDLNLEEKRELNLWAALAVGQSATLVCDYTLRITATAPKLVFSDVEFKKSLRDKLLMGRNHFGWNVDTGLKIDDLKKAAEIVVSVEIDKIGRIIQ